MAVWWKVRMAVGRKGIGGWAQRGGHGQGGLNKFSSFNAWVLKAVDARVQTHTHTMGDREPRTGFCFKSYCMIVQDGEVWEVSFTSSLGCCGCLLGAGAVWAVSTLLLSLIMGIFIGIFDPQNGLRWGRNAGGTRDYALEPDESEWT